MPDRLELVLLHGFSHTGASWQPVIQALAGRFRVLAPDIRGHGVASDRIPADLPGVLDDLLGLAGERFGLVGYSMGGRLALHVALAEPERVERLVLIGASPGLADPGERAARRSSDERLAREIEAAGVEAFSRRWAENPVLAGLPAAVAERVHRDRLGNTPAGLGRALRGLGTGALPSVWERLGELGMPVRLVVGERDRKFQSIAREMSRDMAHAQLIVVAGTGHAVHLEAPRRVAEIIAAAPRDARR
jgi:2-succinyl-6-hydroxy-2,4-cyclohexadiene-1-carboxylate synthase